MCLNPIRIPNPSRRYSADGCQRLWLTVPCGHCAECLAQKRRHWYLRNYFQCKECIDKGGFILFDTLTYDDEHLPHLSDFIPELREIIDKSKDEPFDYEDVSCFDQRDLNLFFKRLRQKLTRYGYEAAHNLEYFYSMEYGSEDAYKDENGRWHKATFRPHYHFLWYCRVPYLTAEALALIIAESWDKGRTDCWNQRDGLRRGYMRLHNVFGAGSPRNSDLDLRKVSCYVSKYVTKEPSYQAKVDKRIKDSIDFMLGYYPMQVWLDNAMYYGYDNPDDYFDDIYKRIESYVGMHHHQSEGFGKYAFEHPEVLKDIEEKGCVTIPDEDKVKVEIAVPQYYMRKLYCGLDEQMDGHKSWFWTCHGRKWKKRMQERSLEFAARKLKDAFLNMPIALRTTVERLMDGSTFEQLAEYELFAKDRILPPKSYDFKEIVSRAKDSDVRYCMPGRQYDYIREEDGSLWRKKPDKCHFRAHRNDYEFVPFQDVGDLVYRDSRFDAVLREFDMYFSPVNREKQDAFDLNERLCRIFKKQKQNS